MTLFIQLWSWMLSRHSSTGFAPAYLMHGESADIIPVELRRDGNLEADRRTAALNSLRSFEANKRRVDRNRKEHEFKVGDLVFVHAGNKLNRGKLVSVRREPFKIVRKISGSIYEVASGKAKSEANLFNSNKLLPFDSPLSDARRGEV